MPTSCFVLFNEDLLSYLLLEFLSPYSLLSVRLLCQAFEDVFQRRCAMDVIGPETGARRECP